MGSALPAIGFFPGILYAKQKYSRLFSPVTAKLFIPQPVVRPSGV